MTAISKFLFSNDSADPTAERARKVEEEPEIEMPVFSEDDVVAAREHGYDAGIAAGKAQATASIERQIEELLSDITEQFCTFTAIIEKQHVLLAQDIATLAGAIADKIIGQQTSEQRAELIYAIVQTSLSRLYQSPEVTMQVAAELAENLKTRFAASDLAITVKIFAEEGLTGTDFRLAWNGGGGERIEADIWREVEDLLHRHMDIPPPAEVTDGDAETDEPPTEDSALVEPASENSGEREAPDIDQPSSGADEAPALQE